MQSSLGSFLWLMEPEESRWFFFFECATFKIKKTFFSFAKEVSCFVFNCSEPFSYPKDTS